SRSSSSLETCLFESPLGWRRRSRATCGLTTFSILFDRAISFMNHPPPVSPPSVNNRLSVAIVQKKRVDVDARNLHRARRAARISDQVFSGDRRARGEVI